MLNSYDYSCIVRGQTNSLRFHHVPSPLTQEEFIQRSTEKHNGKYDYSLVNYKGVHTKVKIICPEHGEFEQSPNSHLHKGQRCKKCGLDFRSKNRTWTTEEFIKEAKLIHGNKYDYSKTTYELSNQKVEIICHKHGSFFQAPQKHLTAKCGCPFCMADNRFLSQEEFVERAQQTHSITYDYSLVIYKDFKTPVTIICPVHGQFDQLPSTHLNSGNCPKCVGKANITQEDFVRRSHVKHKNKYDYSKAIFKNSNTVVEIICPHHGSFWQKATSHLHDGTGCPKCIRTISKDELNWLKYIGIPDNPQHRQVFIKIADKKMHVDGYNPLTKTVYEFLGDFWHGNFMKFNPTDMNKIAKKSFKQLHDETFERFQILKQAGYTVVYVWESDFKAMKNYYKILFEKAFD